MYLWATTFGQDPPVFLGIDPRREPWLAWQVRRAVYSWGSWFDARRHETVERPIPKDQKPKMHVPKWSEGELRAMLGLPSDANVEFGYRTPDGKVYAQRDIERMAKEVLGGAYGDDEDD